MSNFLYAPIEESILVDSQYINLLFNNNGYIGNVHFEEGEDGEIRETFKFENYQNKSKNLKRKRLFASKATTTYVASEFEE